MIGAPEEVRDPYVSSRAGIYLIVTDVDAVKLSGDWAQEKPGKIYALLD